MQILNISRQAAHLLSEGDTAHIDLSGIQNPSRGTEIKVRDRMFPQSNPIRCTIKNITGGMCEIEALPGQRLSDMSMMERTNLASVIRVCT